MKNDILLIFDEVQPSIGITGKMWAFLEFESEMFHVIFWQKHKFVDFKDKEKLDQVNLSLPKVLESILIFMVILLIC